ncbi:MAG TPA: O-antigen ligase family protein [Vicinamibacterales bacterium]|nr:O-antigen ligase family protein [Vicinamibacterales bacterium]
MVPPLLQKLIWLTVATSFFVMFEPAPCDALLGSTLVVAAIAGRHYVLPSVGFGIYASLFVVILANLVSLGLAEDPLYGLRFFAITVYMFAAFLLFAGLIGVEGPKMVTHLTNALFVAALAAVAVGLLAKFRLIPHPEIFFRDEFMLRIKSTFKDPNVFAPFVVTAFMFSFSRVIDGGRGAKLAAMLTIPFAVAILLAASRGAWVLCAIALFVYLGAHVLIVRRPAALGRIALAGALVPLVAVPVLVYFVTATHSGSYLAGRMGLKSYDTEERFVNHAAAIGVGLENPLGIGPGMYSPTRGLMAVHNLYIRLFVENGLLGLVGFLCFLAFVMWRMARGIFARGEHAGTYACCLAIVMGTLVESYIIDTLHWRHLFLVMAIPVGLWLYEARQTDEVVQMDTPPEPDALAPAHVASGSG